MDYVPNTHKDVEAMLRAIGVSSVEELFEVIPEPARLQRLLELPPGLSEPELVRLMEGIASENQPAGEMLSFLGGGVSDHFIPSVVPALVGRSEFYTAYTPYQPEISQGMLQAIFEFQTAVCQLLAMDVANASMYDGATALAEAVIMAVGETERKEVLVPRSLHPHYRQVLGTYLEGMDVRLVEVPFTGLGQTDLAGLTEALGEGTAAVIVQQPNFFGALEPVEEISRKARAAGALLIAVADPIAAALLKPPGEYGADIAVAEGQPLGLSMNYGGPLLGLFACRQSLVRRMPGRIVGQTTDAKGRIGYCLTLQAREQHIRREKATSNICTNQTLCALAAVIYLAAMGPKNLAEIAAQCLQKAHYFADLLHGVAGIPRRFEAPFFREFVVKLAGEPGEILKELRAQRIYGGIPLGRYYPELSDCLLISVTERRTREELERATEAFRRVLAGKGVAAR